MTAPDVAPKSPLARLREARERAQAALHIDLPVPRLEPTLYVRYLPLATDLLSELDDRRTKELGDPKTRTSANIMHGARTLAAACAGLFTVDEQGAPVGDPDTWPRFDAELAEALGVGFVNAALVVRALYLTDGDLTATGNKVVEFSGYSRDLQARTDSGE